jgi:alpha-L-rhamnosidase
MEENQRNLTGLPSAWKAVWIDPELPGEENCENEKRPASVLRKRFTLEKAGEGILYITCHGLYTAFLNGKRVGDFVLAPGTGDYHKRLCVQAYEVSDLLVPGENELTVTLGDGWYRGSVGIDGLTNYYGKDLALLCQLEAGGEIVLASDGTWEASQEGPVRENDLQQGEAYDARREVITSWHGVRECGFGYENLAPTESVPVTENERFEGKLLRTPSGERVIDFGQNLAGYTQIRVRAHAGDVITLWHGETLDENGNFTQRNFDPGDRSKGGIPQKITYICKEGENLYKPSFTVFGFRYAKVETEIDLSEAEFTAVALCSRMKQTGFFECGNALVNRLFLNSVWSMKSNFIDIPTDCPTRERAGWTGDAGVFAPTAVMLMDCYPVLRKWLGECRLAQGEDGLVQNIAPVNNKGGMISGMLQGSAGWGDACILVPWALYQAYGRMEILEENYEMMQGWMEFCRKRAEKTRLHNLKNPYHRYLVDQGFHFGEWCQPDVDNTEAMKKAMMSGAPEVATAYFYRSAFLMAEIARLLKKTEDADTYAAIAWKIRRAYRFCCLKEGRIRSSRQCEYVRPLAFGLLDKDEEQAAADALNDLVVSSGYHLNTGFLSTPDLCRVLSEHGHTDTAYRLLLQKECPSWLYAVTKGATTIWETWDGIREDGTVHDSLNHYSYGAVSGWLLDGVCGIRLRAGRLTIAPHPDRSLGFARGRWESPWGTIESSWEYRDDRIVFDIKVPVPARAALPDGSVHEVKKGEWHYEVYLQSPEH